QEAKRHAYARTEPTLFDRVAHEQKTTEGQRDAPDIDRPVRPKGLFKPAPGRPGEKPRRLYGLGLLLVQGRAFRHTDAFVCPDIRLLGLNGGRFGPWHSGRGGLRALRHTQ